MAHLELRRTGDQELEVLPYMDITRDSAPNFRPLSIRSISEAEDESGHANYHAVVTESNADVYASTVHLNDTRNHEHESAQSRHGPFAKLLSLWIWTTILTALVASIVNIYNHKDVLSSSQEQTYNIFTTILILFLGLSFFEAFKELASAAKLQKKIVHLSNSQREEKELIGNFDSLLKVARLIRVTGAWGLRLFCLFWLVINLTAQVLAALINLEATVQGGNDYNGTYFSQGLVRVADLHCYYHDQEKCAIAGSPRQGLAHAYGEIAITSGCGNYTILDDILMSRINYPYFCRLGQPEFIHRFYEYNPNDTQSAYPYFTQRTLMVSAGACDEFELVGNDTDSMVGDETARKHMYRNVKDSTMGDITIPISYEGREGTTYIYRNPRFPADVDDECGDRCILMWAFVNPGADEYGRFYRCPITVGNVVNAAQPAHQVPNIVARVAAASIALQGQYHYRNPKKPDNRQFQFYAKEHPLELHYHDLHKAASNMAQFTMGSLITMMDKNPPTYIQGTVPHLGGRVKVKWGPFVGILICIVATHFAVFALTYFLA